MIRSAVVFLAAAVALPLAAQTPATPAPGNLYAQYLVDTTAASTDYEQTIGFYQILNQGNGNLTNQPLKPKAPTLSRTDMITF